MNTISQRPPEETGLTVNGRLPAVAGALGILGSLACSTAMVMALLGLLGAGVAASASSAGDMAGMSSAPPPVPHSSSLPAPLLSLFIFLLQGGPVILIASIAATALAVGVRRRIALVPVALAGLALYWGMYLQSTRPVMYAAVVAGLVALVAAYLSSYRAVTAKC